MHRITETLLFIDGADPEETAQARRLLGYIDGQTTNPSLVAKNPEIAARIARGEKLTRAELLAAYKEIITGIAASTDGPVSIEVYADASTTTQEMVRQAEEMAAWTPKAVIKLPITAAGLSAATRLCRHVRLNLTLCFSQGQAAAVYAATRNAADPVFVSPFMGRLDDRGENGIDLVANLLRMFDGSDGHVQVLAASLRNMDHILACLALKTQALTLPFRVFSQWAQEGFPIPGTDYVYRTTLRPLPFQENITLTRPGSAYDIHHPLTDAGLQKFADDWNALLTSP